MLLVVGVFVIRYFRFPCWCFGFLVICRRSTSSIYNPKKFLKYLCVLYKTMEKSTCVPCTHMHCTCTTYTYITLIFIHILTFVHAGHNNYISCVICRLCFSSEPFTMIKRIALVKIEQTHASALPFGVCISRDGKSHLSHIYSFIKWCTNRKRKSEREGAWESRRTLSKWAVALHHDMNRNADYLLLKARSFSNVSASFDAIHFLICSTWSEAKTRQ